MNGNHHFTKVSQRAAERLQYFIDLEFSHWTVEQLDPVILSVSSAINETPIKQNFLLQSIYDPAELKTQIFEYSDKHMLGLNSEETRLFEVLLEQSCGLIIDFYIGLPNFTQRTLVELLTKDDQILSAIKSVSDEIRNMQEGSYGTMHGVDTRKFRYEYLRTVVRHLRWMELYGSDLSAPSRKYGLDIAYINLLVKSKHSTDNSIVRADKAIQMATRLFIRGAAGSGKTTLLKWIAVNAASREFNNKLESWNDLVPFLIRLRQCVDDPKLPAPENFPSLIAPNIAHVAPKHWVHNLLNDGNAIILIDGLDEIERRDEVKKWVEDLVTTFPKSRFIVTSRPLDKNDLWEIPEEFQELELQRMDPLDIIQFINNWHKSVQNELSNIEEINEIEAVAQDLIYIVNTNSAIRNLASSPLLCAMICALHRDKHRVLPKNRIELYEACTKMLLEEREVARGIKLQEYPKLTYSEIVQLLSELAFYLLRNGYSEIQRGRAKDQIARYLKLLSTDTQKYAPNKVLAFFVERTGLIFEPSENIIGFVHRTFQEYLAAKAIIDKDELGLLYKPEHVVSPLWREVIILAAGLANKPQREELFENLLTSNEYGEKTKAAELLAVACLETVIKLDPAIREILRDRLKSIMPPKSREEAKILALAGELAIPHLQYSESNYPEYCISTLELIGSPEVVHTLMGYLQSKDTSILNNVTTALKNLGSNEQIINKLSEVRIKQFEVSPSVPVELLDYLLNIETLIIKDLDDATLNGRLDRIQSIERLLIQDCDIASLDVLQNVTIIGELNIKGCRKLKNISALSKLNSLRILVLEDLSVSDFEPITNLISLEEMRFNKLNIVKLPKLREFMSLTWIELMNCPHLHDIQSLTNFSKLFKGLGSTHDRSHSSVSYKDTNAPNLTRITIGNCPKLMSLSALSDKRKLRQIELWNSSGNKPNIIIPPHLKEKVTYIG